MENSMGTNEQRLSDYVFQFLAEKGLKAVFLVPGGGSMYLVDALGSNANIEFVPMHHEQSAAIAAEGYARTTGSLGCALVTTGPGGTNAITAVAGSWIESIPLLILSGQVKRADLIGKRGVRQMGVQEVDITAVVKPITKYAVVVDDPSQIRFELEKALHFATTGRNGPVWLDIPLDVQAAKINPETLKSFTPKIESKPNLDGICSQVIELINAAKRPVLLAGHGVRLSGAKDEFARFYELLGIPVATTWNAMDLIPSNSPLSVGKPGVVALRGANFAIQNSDLILVIGARLDNLVTAYNPAKFGRSAKKILVDIDSAELNKFSTDMKIEHSVVADARDFINCLLTQQEKITKVDRSPWLTQCQGWQRRYPINDALPFPKEGPITSYHMTKVLMDEIPENTHISTGTAGLSIEVFFMAFKNKPGQRIFLNTGLGAMGYGVPTMIGSSIALNRQPIVAVESDGSLMMNVQELQTIKTLNLPIKLFIFNNAGYSSIRSTQRNYFEGRYIGTGPESKLGFPDILDLAKAYGIEAFQIRDAKDLISGVRFGLDHPGPIIIDVHIKADEALWPKSAALPQADGSMRSMPLEDMSPLLSREEFTKNMVVPLDPASENIPDHLIEQSRKIKQS